jgi:hypothetical protein
VEARVIPIFMTSWHRPDFTWVALSQIAARTIAPHEVHVWDNGSAPEEQATLREIHQSKECHHLYLHAHNRGCCFPKGIYRALAGDADFFVLTDNDACPPKVTPCWLTELERIMRAHDELGCLALRCPPEWLQQPMPGDLDGTNEIVRCKAVGNQFKMIRSEAWPHDWTEETRGKTFGDDAILCDLMARDGWLTAFTRNIWCLHAGQCEDWGYTKSQVNEDPRKAGYGKPYTYKYNPLTYEPTA